MSIQRPRHRTLSTNDDALPGGKDTDKGRTDWQSEYSGGRVLKSQSIVNTSGDPDYLGRARV
jgi:hypothetical protein